MDYPPYPQHQPQYPQPYQQPVPYPPMYAYPVYVRPPMNGVAVPAMVRGIVGIFVWICAPIALVLGHVGLHQIHRTGEEGRGQAITGIVLGWLVTGPWLLVIFLLIIGAIGASA